MKVKELFEVLNPITDPIIRIYDYAADKNIEFRFSKREQEPFVAFQVRRIQPSSVIAGTDWQEIDYVDLVVE